MNLHLSTAHLHSEQIKCESLTSAAAADGPQVAQSAVEHQEVRSGTTEGQINFILLIWK